MVSRFRRWREASTAGAAYFEAVLRVRGKPLRIEIKPDGTPN